MKAHARRSVLAVLTIITVATSGCLFAPGPDVLERLQRERGSVYRRVTFKRELATDESAPIWQMPASKSLKPLSSLRETCVYWSTPTRAGTPRWKGTLVPRPETLYTDIIERIDAGEKSITLVSYLYDAIGIDALTLVDYIDADESPIGTDWVAYQTPSSATTSSIEGGDGGGSGGGTVGYEDMSWWEYPQLVLLDAPIYLAIGVKELAFEIVKSPFSLIEAGAHGTFFERRPPITPVSGKRAALGFVEDWRNGFTALSWRFRARRRHTPIDTLRDLGGALPIVGPLLDHKSPPPGSATVRTRDIVIGQGIHADSAAEQMTRAWEGGVREYRGDARVWSSPYLYGGVADVVWSMFNFSNGMGYELAREIVFDHGSRPDRGVELIGFSGSVQRSLGAARALRSAGITVNRLVGIAGPCVGFSCARESHLLLGDGIIEDPVDLSARAADILWPFPTNVRTHTVKGAGRHHTPFFPHPATREPSLGYAARLREVLGGR